MQTFDPTKGPISGPPPSAQPATDVPQADTPPPQPAPAATPVPPSEVQQGVIAGNAAKATDSVGSTDLTRYRGSFLERAIQSFDRTLQGSSGARASADYGDSWRLFTQPSLSDSDREYLRGMASGRRFLVVYDAIHNGGDVGAIYDLSKSHLNRPRIASLVNLCIEVREGKLPRQAPIIGTDYYSEAVVKVISGSNPDSSHRKILEGAADGRYPLLTRDGKVISPESVRRYLSGEKRPVIFVNRFPTASTSIPPTSQTVSTAAHESGTATSTAGAGVASSDATPVVPDAEAQAALAHEQQISREGYLKRQVHDFYKILNGEGISADYRANWEFLVEGLSELDRATIIREEGGAKLLAIHDVIHNGGDKTPIYDLAKPPSKMGHARVSSIVVLADQISTGKQDLVRRGPVVVSGLYHDAVTLMERYRKPTSKASPGAIHILERASAGEFPLIDRKTGQVYSPDTIATYLASRKSGHAMSGALVMFDMLPTHGGVPQVAGTTGAPAVATSVDTPVTEVFKKYERVLGSNQRGSREADLTQFGEILEKGFTPEQESILRTQGATGELILEVSNCIRDGNEARLNGDRTRVSRNEARLIELGRTHKWPLYKVAVLVYLARGGAPRDIGNISPHLYDTANTMAVWTRDPNLRPRNGGRAAKYLDGRLDTASSGIGQMLDSMADGKIPVIDDDGVIIEPRFAAEARAASKRSLANNRFMLAETLIEEVISAEERELRTQIVNSVRSLVKGGDIDGSLDAHEEDVARRLADEVKARVDVRRRMLSSRTVYTDPEVWLRDYPTAAISDLGFAIDSGVLEMPQGEARRQVVRALRMRPQNPVPPSAQEYLPPVITQDGRSSREILNTHITPDGAIGVSGDYEQHPPLQGGQPVYGEVRTGITTQDELNQNLGNLGPSPTREQIAVLETRARNGGLTPLEIESVLSGKWRPMLAVSGGAAAAAPPPPPPVTPPPATPPADPAAAASQRVVSPLPDIDKLSAKAVAGPDDGRSGNNVGVAKLNIERGNVFGNRNPGGSIQLERSPWLIGTQLFTRAELQLLVQEAQGGDHHSELVLRLYCAAHTGDAPEVVRIFRENTNLGPEATLSRANSVVASVRMGRFIEPQAFYDAHGVVTTYQGRGGTFADATISAWRRADKQLPGLVVFEDPNIPLLDSTGRPIDVNARANVFDVYKGIRTSNGFDLHANVAVAGVHDTTSEVAARTVDQFNKILGKDRSGKHGGAGKVENCDWMTKQRHSFTQAERIALGARGDAGRLVIAASDAIHKGDVDTLLRLGRENEWPHTKVAALIHIAQGGTQASLKELIRSGMQERYYSPAQAVVTRHLIPPSQRSPIYRAGDAGQYLAGQQAIPDWDARTLGMVARGEIVLIDRNYNILRPEDAAAALRACRNSYAQVHPIQTDGQRAGVPSKPPARPTPPPASSPVVDSPTYGHGYSYGGGSGGGLSLSLRAQQSHVMSLMLQIGNIREGEEQFVDLVASELGFSTDELSQKQKEVLSKLVTIDLETGDPNDARELRREAIRELYRSYSDPVERREALTVVLKTEAAILGRRGEVTRYTDLHTDAERNAFKVLIGVASEDDSSTVHDALMEFSDNRKKVVIRAVMYAKRRMYERVLADVQLGESFDNLRDYQKAGLMVYWETGNKVDLENLVGSNNENSPNDVIPEVEEVTDLTKKLREIPSANDKAEKVVERARRSAELKEGSFPKLRNLTLRQQELLHEYLSVEWNRGDGTTPAGRRYAVLHQSGVSDTDRRAVVVAAEEVHRFNLSKEPIPNYNDLPEPQQRAVRALILWDRESDPAEARTTRAMLAAEGVEPERMFALAEAYRERAEGELTRSWRGERAYHDTLTPPQRRNALLVVITGNPDKDESVNNFVREATGTRSTATGQGQSVATSTDPEETKAIETKKQNEAIRTAKDRASTLRTRLTALREIGHNKPWDLEWLKESISDETREWLLRNDNETGGGRGAQILRLHKAVANGDVNEVRAWIDEFGSNHKLHEGRVNEVLAVAEENHTRLTSQPSVSVVADGPDTPHTGSPAPPVSPSAASGHAKQAPVTRGVQITEALAAVASTDTSTPPAMQTATLSETPATQVIEASTKSAATPPQPSTTPSSDRSTRIRELASAYDSGGDNQNRNTILSIVGRGEIPADEIDKAFEGLESGRAKELKRQAKGLAERKHAAKLASSVGSTGSGSTGGAAPAKPVVVDVGNGGRNNGDGGTSASRREVGATYGNQQVVVEGGAAAKLDAEVGRVEVAKDEPRPAQRAELKDRNKGSEEREDLRKRRTAALQEMHARRDNIGVHDGRGNNLGEGREVGRRESTRPAQGNSVVAANDNEYAGGKVIPIRSEGSRQSTTTSSGQTVRASNSQNVVVNNTTQSVPSTQVGTAQTGTNGQSTGTTQIGTTANGQTVVVSNTPNGTGTGSTLIGGTATQAGANAQPTANSQAPTNTQVGTSAQAETKPSGSTQVGSIKIDVKKAQESVVKGTDGSVIRVKEGEVVVERGVGGSNGGNGEVAIDKKEGFWAKNHRRDRGLGVVVGGVWEGVKVAVGGAIGIHRKADGSRYRMKEAVVEGGKMALQGTVIGGVVDIGTNVVGKGGAFLAEQGAKGLTKLAMYGASGAGRAAAILSKAAPTLAKVAPAVGGTAKHIPGVVGNSIGVVMSASEGIGEAIHDYKVNKVGKTVTVARIGVTGGAAVSSVLIGGYAGGVAATATVFIVGGTAATGGVLLPVVAAVVVGGVVTYLVYKGVRGIGEGAIHLAGKIADSKTFKTLVRSLDKNVVQVLGRTGRTLVESLDKNIVQVVGRTVVDPLARGAKAGIEGVKAGYRATTQALDKGATAIAKGVKEGCNTVVKVANDMKEKAKAAVSEEVNKAKATVNEAKVAVNKELDKAKTAVNEGVDKAKATANEAMNSVKNRLTSTASTLRGWLS